MLLSREHPWHIRRVSHRHLHDYRNLKDLHLLTQAWDPAQEVPNPFAQEPTLEDDTWPEDVLARLEKRVREEQLRAVARLLKSGPEAATLAERSYQAGQDSAASRWTRTDPSEGSIAPADKRALWLALAHGPLSGRLGADAFLVRRSLITEVTVELRQCPHCLLESGEITAPAAVVEETCQQQFHWLRGYFGFLNPAILPAHVRKAGRCGVSW